MDDGHRPTASPPRRRAKASDDVRAWGSLDVWPGTYGFQKYRLVVFPPGIDSTERRYLRVARSWPTWGAALWLVLAVGLSGRGEGWNALAYPTIAFLLSGAIAFALARGAHAHTRTLVAVVIAGYDDPEASARFARLERLARTLFTADTMRDRGELTIVEHEAVWWMAYEAIDPKDRSHV